MTFSDSLSFPVASLIGAVIALIAWRAGSLDARGAMVAAAVGALAMAAGTGWGAYLVLWFALAALLSRVGRRVKAQRTRSVLEPGDGRNAFQVLANGGVFALCAAWSRFVVDVGAGDVVGRSDPAHDMLALAAIGSLCAAGADTWATEIGTLGRGRPWSLREHRRVPVGTSGAMSAIGSVAAVAGAFFLAALAAALGVVPRSAVPALALAGVVGAFIDTLVGAWLQERRWCPSCDRPTERRVHDCGASTLQRGGLSMLRNDAVNLLCTLAGALLAVLYHRALMGS